MGTPRKPGCKILAIDYGRVRIGLALGDGEGISCHPLGFIPRQNDKQAAQVVVAMARQHHAGELLIGLPLHAHGGVGESVQWVREFISALKLQTNLPIHEVDERYSSAEAEDILRQEGRWPAPPGTIDAKAAAILLRRWFDGE